MSWFSVVYNIDLNGVPWDRVRKGTAAERGLTKQKHEDSNRPTGQHRKGAAEQGNHDNKIAVDSRIPSSTEHALSLWCVST